MNHSRQCDTETWVMAPAARRTWLERCASDRTVRYCESVYDLAAELIEAEKAHKTIAVWIDVETLAPDEMAIFSRAARGGIVADLAAIGSSPTRHRDRLALARMLGAHRTLVAGERIDPVADTAAACAAPETGETTEQTPPYAEPAIDLQRDAAIQAMLDTENPAVTDELPADTDNELENLLNADHSTASWDRHVPGVLSAEELRALLDDGDEAPDDTSDNNDDDDTDFLTGGAR